MLYQLNYEATQLGASHVLHTSSSWGLIFSMPFWPGLSYATLVSLDSADQLAQGGCGRLREVTESKHRPNQHSGSLNNWGENAAICKSLDSLVFSDKDDKP